MAGSTAYGEITKCVQARVFSRPTIQSNVIGVVPRGTQVMIVNRDRNSDYFYKVVTSDGRRGYCMRVFIDVMADYTKSQIDEATSE